MKSALHFLRDFGRLYNDKHLTRASAALSYYLTMTFFPLIVCLYTLLGSSYEKASAALSFFGSFFAEETSRAIGNFLLYVALHNNQSMMLAAALVLVTSASAAWRSLQSSIGDMQGKQRYGGLEDLLFSFLFALLFVAAIYISILILLTGPAVIDWLNRVLPFVDISASWNVLRFVVLAAIVYFVDIGIYRFSRPIEEPYHTRVGAAFATLAMVGVSIVFSLIINRSGRYPLVYGSLASVILLMLWLYTSCLVIYCGAAVNVLLRDRERARRTESIEEN